MVRPSKKRIRYLIKDEKKAAAEYKRYGYTSLSRDEASHRRFLMKRLNRGSYRAKRR